MENRKSSWCTLLYKVLLTTFEEFVLCCFFFSAFVCVDVLNYSTDSGGGGGDEDAALQIVVPVNMRSSTRVRMSDLHTIIKYKIYAT